MTEPPRPPEPPPADKPAEGLFQEPLPQPPPLPGEGENLPLPLSASGRGPGGGVASLPLSASGRGPGGGVLERGPEPAPVVDAENLFRGQREVLIEHDGVRYRLRITRRNKLILQK